MTFGGWRYLVRRARFAMAWKFEPRDLWVGVFIGTWVRGVCWEVYVCPVPALVFRISSPAYGYLQDHSVTDRGRRVR